MTAKTASAKHTYGIPALRRKPPARAEDRKSYGRNKITNHRDLLPNVDGNRREARRFRDLVQAFIADAGGIENCSEIKIGLLRRLAATTVQSELIEARMVNGEQVDIGTLCTLASTCMRLSVKAGITRTPRDVTVIDPLAYAKQFDTSDEVDEAVS